MRTTAVPHTSWKIARRHRPRDQREVGQSKGAAMTAVEVSVVHDHAGRIISVSQFAHGVRARVLAPPASVRGTPSPAWAWARTGFPTRRRRNTTRSPRSRFRSFASGANTVIRRVGGAGCVHAGHNMPRRNEEGFWWRAAEAERRRTAAATRRDPRDDAEIRAAAAHAW